jgi:hypothetical protein
MSIEAMKYALQALEDPWGSGPEGVANAIAFLRQAIAEAEKQESVHASDISQERVDETAKHGHEPVPNDYDRSIHSNPDAQAWAKFFMATVNEQEWCIDDIDESLMTGWFANAMMAMHDHVKREWVGLDGDIPGLGLVTEEFYNGMLCAEDILRRRNT